MRGWQGADGLKYEWARNQISCREKRVGCISRDAPKYCVHTTRAFPKRDKETAVGQRCDFCLVQRHRVSFSTPSTYSTPFGHAEERVSHWSVLMVSGVQSVRLMTPRGCGGRLGGVPRNDEWSHITVKGRFLLSNVPHGDSTHY